MNYPINKKPRPLKILFFIGMAVLFCFVLGNIVMFLWNAILPDLVGVKQINMWQAIGLFVLSRILFGGFKGRSHHRGGKAKKWKNKWMQMDDSERKQFKNKWQAYCDRKEE